MWYLSLSVWVFSLELMLSRSIPFAANVWISFFVITKQYLIVYYAMCQTWTRRQWLLANSALSKSVKLNVAFPGKAHS